jgi:mannitol/fructose-specific phosphotransferase system IIA component (Ntr-type)
LHLIARVTAGDLKTRALESELREIVHERDRVVKDRFDRIIEQCEVLDLKGPASAEEFLRSAAQALSRRMDLPEPVLFEMLLERERRDATAISPTLAIPHIVVEGQGVFDILVARCREGVAFSEHAPAVRAIFVLVGSLDQRNTYLRALAAIAQTALEGQFDAAWQRAKSAEDLRDVILLSERRREEKP